MTAIDRLLATIGIGLWVTLIACAVLIFVAIRRNRADTSETAEAFQLGWTEGTLDALRAHGPTTGDPDARLLWVVNVKQTEPNPYLTEDRSQ